MPLKKGVRHSPTFPYKVIKSGNEWHAEVDGRGFGIKQDLISLFFLYLCIY